MENEIVAALRRIIRAVDLHSRKLYEQYGLTGPQLAVLHHVDRLQGAPASALARAAHLSRPTITGILDRLSRRGLVERRPDPRDRRSHRVHATEAGREMLANAPSLLQHRFRRELAALEDWEQAMMLSSLQRMAAMMDAESLSAAPVLATGPMGHDDMPPSPVHSEPTDNQSHNRN